MRSLASSCRSLLNTIVPGCAAIAVNGRSQVRRRVVPRYSSLLRVPEGGKSFRERAEDLASRLHPHDREGCQRRNRLEWDMLYGPCSRIETRTKPNAHLTSPSSSL